MAPRRTVVLVILAAVLAGVCGESEPLTPLASGDFMQEVRQECRNTTGNDKAYEELVTVLNNDTPRCFMQHVNMTYLQAPMDELSKQEAEKALEQICGQIEKSLVCVKPVVAKIKPCISDEDDMNILQKIVDTVPVALKMICSNNGMMLLKLREPLSRSCAVELAPTIDDCLDVISNKTMETDLSEYTITECSEIYKMRDCITNKIRDCGALTYLELFTLFYRNLLTLTPCK